VVYTCNKAITINVELVTTNALFVNEDFILCIGTENFEWNRYLKEKDAEAAPKGTFQKVHKKQYLRYV